MDESDLAEETRMYLLHLEAEGYHDSGDHARAVATCDRILARRDDPIAHANRGLVYWAKGDTQRAVESYEQAKRRGSADLVVLRSLGELHNRRGEYAPWP